jgi:Flp pilus assembly protein CpaB
MCNVAYHFKVNCIVNDFFKRLYTFFRRNCKTTQKSKKMSNMGLTKIQVLAKRKQFLVGEDSQSSIQRSTLRMSPCGA